MFDAIVLAGGSARRLQGADKVAVQVAGVSLLDHVLAATTAAARTVVIGPARSVPRPVIWCRENPPGGGPVAALAAGIDEVLAPVVLVLAGDLPGIDGAIAPLLAALGARPGADAAVLVDDAGRRNYLAAAWRTGSLRAALRALAQPAGAAARTLYADRAVLEVLDAGEWGRDCDTWADLAEARRAGTADRGGPA